MRKYQGGRQGTGGPRNTKGLRPLRNRVEDAPTELLLELLSILEEVLPGGPSSARIRLRDLRFKLVGTSIASETDVAQMMAEEDGEPVEPEEAEDATQRSTKARRP